VARPAAQERIKLLMERGFHKPGDAETRLGYYVGQLKRQEEEVAWWACRIGLPALKSHYDCRVRTWGRQLEIRLR
jgi:hypothetical protein